MTVRRACVLGVIALVAAACSGGDEPEATAPPPTAAGEQSAVTEVTEVDGGRESSDAPETTDSDGSATTEVPLTDPSETTTSAAPTTAESTTTTAPEPERRLPESLGPVTTSIPYPDAPGVGAPGEFYEIYDMGYVYLPFEDDPDDPNIVAPADDDLPIIAAYAEREAAVAEATFVERVLAEPTERVREAYVDRGEEFTRTVLARFASEGFRNEFLFGEPDVYRPVLVERNAGSATVRDCQLLSSATVDSDGQPLSSNIAPYFEFGIRVELARVDSVWKVLSGEEDDESCVSG